MIKQEKTMPIYVKGRKEKVQTYLMCIRRENRRTKAKYQVQNERITSNIKKRKRTKDVVE
jgi:hypothetical protein